MIPINFQPIEKKIVSDGSVLQIHSIFYTIQGEGPFTGHPAVFVRLAGCNLQCPSCDTDYTNGRIETTVPDIVNSVIKHAGFITGKKSPNLVVITGGEPFRQNISLLVRVLVARNIRVQIETNGTLGLSLDFPRSALQGVLPMVTIVCSPKTGKINLEIDDTAACFKYVMSHDSVDPIDGLPILALNHTAKPRLFRGLRRPIYLQPMDPGNKDAYEYDRNVEAVKTSCMKHGYILQLQTHKLLRME